MSDILRQVGRPRVLLAVGLVLLGSGPAGAQFNVPRFGAPTQQPSVGMNYSALAGTFNYFPTSSLTGGIGGGSFGGVGGIGGILADGLGAGRGR